ncbi:unnamed protein product [Rotaria sp. Silwood1]|nr:unnamed protein product [Rotaria sp. Silwood1]
MTSTNITCQILVLGSIGSGRTTLIKTIIGENIVHETISGTKYEQIKYLDKHLTFIKISTFETNDHSWHEVQKFIRNNLLPIHAIWLLLHYQSDVDENLLNQLKILPHVPSSIILNKADFLQNLFSSQSELEKDIKYFDDINQKDFPNYFRNNHILMVKRECLMKWKINNEDIVNLQHIFLMSLIDEDKTHRPIGVRENII